MKHYVSEKLLYSFIVGDSFLFFFREVILLVYPYIFLNSIKKLGCVCAQLLSHVQLCNPTDYVAYQAPQSIGFSKQEHWGGLPFPKHNFFT